MEHQNYFQNSLKATKDISLLSNSEIDKMLLALADAVDENIPVLLRENQKDLDLMAEDDPKYDRLRLNPAIINGIAEDIRKVAELQNPLGTVLSERVMPNGLQISKVRVPLGVVGVIYEARPNVTLDVFALCFKTGNVCILKGGSDAEFSNKAIINVIHQVLRRTSAQHSFCDLIAS